MKSKPQAYMPRGQRCAIGDHVSFTPTAFINYDDAVTKLRLDGCVIYVNEAHGFYVVEAECYGYRIREAFLF